MTTTQLSKNAAVLLEAIKNSNVWEEKAIEILFPAPVTYSKETAAEFWQWQENIYGNGTNRPVNGEHVDFKMNIEKSYADQAYEAVKELKAAGLLISKNAGYNNYYYQYTGK